jgi:hypothetical protein
MNVTTIFGQSIHEELTSKLHSSYGQNQFINSYDMTRDSNSNEFKKVTWAYYFNEESQLWSRDYFLKSDCVRYHRNPNNEGNTYIACISLSHTISIQYADKTLYFMSHEQRFNAGYVYSLDEHRWLDLKVTDKHMFGDLVLIRKANDKMDYVAKKYSTIYESMISSLVRTRNTISMSQCPSKRFILLVTFDHQDVVTCSISNDRFLRTDCRDFNVANHIGTNELIHISHNQAMRLSRGHRYNFTLTNGLNMEFTYNPMWHEGIYYFDMQSAETNGYVNRTCPICNSTLDAQHDADVCARRNHKNPRYDYHRDFSVKQIQLEQKFVFKMGVEIEKQSYLGSKHSNVSIGQRFGWKKERDGSLCGTIGYELVSPCYPLFTDDLINEAKEIEQAFPNLINGNDHDLISHSRGNSACGGHIHFSRSYTSAKDTFEMISGYIPLFYAIYRKRSESDYCGAKEKSRMKESTEKMQAVRIIEDIVNPRIEFRIFPLVKDIDQLQWRIELLRIMANNPTNRFNEVANMLTDKESDLYQHMAKEFSPSKIKQRILDSIDMAKRYDRDFYSFDFSSITNAVNNM